MIRQPQSSSIYHRPYRECYNVASIYTGIGYAPSADGAELTDEQINELTESDIDLCVARGDSMFNVDIHADLVGDDYADAILADLNY